MRPAAAKRLLQLQAQGKYHADNPGDLRDIQTTAAGNPVRSQSGAMVHIDARVMRVLIALIGNGHTIGTFAICSDHHDDGPHGHADLQISALSIPGADSFYGAQTMQEHCNHIHVGY